MTPPKTILTFIDRPHAWPTALRGDLLARVHRSIGQPMRHWIVTREGQFTAAEAARLGIRTAGVTRFDDYTDSAQVMADRLLMTGAAYGAEGRIYLPWAGAQGYAPPQRLHGRRSPCDVQLWGPHWADGPVGPSATLLRWTAIHEHANGPADWVFGFSPQGSARLQAVAAALTGRPAATVLRPRLDLMPSMTQLRRLWDGRAARWSAMQCKYELAPAQSRFGMRKAQAARLARMPADNPPDPGHLGMLRRAEEALERCDWRDANQWLLGLCKTVTRMQSGQVGVRFAPSRQMRTQIIALLDALGL